MRARLLSPARARLSPLQFVQSKACLPLVEELLGSKGDELKKVDHLFWSEYEVRDDDCAHHPRRSFYSERGVLCDRATERSLRCVRVCGAGAR